MKASAVFACVMVLAQTIGALPRQIYRRVDEDEVESAFSHPLQRVLNRKPNQLQTAMEFWEMQVAFGALFGKSYAKIVPDARGQIKSLDILRPDYVRTELLGSGRLRFRYTDPYTGREEVFLQEELFRIPGFSFNGIEGIAPIVFAKDPIGLALAAEMFAAKYFKQDATPSVVLEHPKTLSTGAAARIRQAWKDIHAGLRNAWSVAVLEEGMQLKSIGINNKDSQFIEQRKFMILEICRYFRIPPHMVGEMDKATFSNIEQQSIDFVRHTIKPWCTRIEQRVDTDLIELVSTEDYFLKHDLDDMLKGEIQPRYAAYNQAISSGWMTRNEVRLKENMNPLKGLDDPLTPVNLSSDKGGAPKQPAEDARAVSAARSVLVDAFERITSAELEATAALVKKHGGGAFAAKVEEYYSTKLPSYATKALAPCEGMCRLLGYDPEAAHDWAANYASSRGHALATAEDPAALIQQWEEDTGAAAAHASAYILKAQGDHHA